MFIRGGMRAIQIAGIAAAGVVVFGGAAVAGAVVVENHAPAPIIVMQAAPAKTAPAPAKTRIKHRTKIIIVKPPASSQPAPASPAAPPQVTWGAPPDPGPAYAADIANSGITAPYGWLMSTGRTLCADWAAGETVTQTDPVLTAGDIPPTTWRSSTRLPTPTCAQISRPNINCGGQFRSPNFVIGNVWTAAHSRLNGNR